MINVVITGAQGFIARNLLVHLQRMENIAVKELDRNSDTAEWEKQLDQADIVFHLAGTNRPPDPAHFQKDNSDLTALTVDRLEKGGKPYRLIFASSTQAALDNPYGKSKKEAEDYIHQHVKNGSAVIYRLPGVFGKWCRPNYNSVVATYCYNSTHGLPLEVRDPDFELRLVYIDDIIRSFIAHIQQPANTGISAAKVDPEFVVSLGKLAATIHSFQTNRKSLFIADMGNRLEKALYSTWLTYLPTSDFSYELELKTDNRGSLFELLKTKTSGQIFISTTLPGVTRGNHFHHTKTEKFVVIQGNGRIQFRSALGEHIIEYDVDGVQPKVVDIPPGYTHNITNTGEDTMITLFWANEPFDPQNPDTFFEKV
jgi:UDP-2-acetamido-2,6-beta-L-arabino-hexul-4-ose reductase